MAVITKVDVSLDITQLAQEVASVITMILGMYQGREVKIFRQIDERVRATLAGLEHDERTIAAEEATDDFTFSLCPLTVCNVAYRLMLSPLE